MRLITLAFRTERKRKTRVRLSSAAGLSVRCKQKGHKRDNRIKKKKQSNKEKKEVVSK